MAQPVDQPALPALRRVLDAWWTQFRRTPSGLLCALLCAGLLAIAAVYGVATYGFSVARPTRVLLAMVPLVLSHALGLWVLWRRIAIIPWGEAIALLIIFGNGLALWTIPQTYHFSSEMGGLWLVSALLALPLVYLFNSVAGASYYLLAVMLWAVETRTGDARHALEVWPLTLLLVPYAYVIFRDTWGSIRANILARAIALYFAWGFATLLTRSDPRLMVIILSSLVSGLVLLAPTWPSSGIRNPFEWMGGLCALAVMLLASMGVFWGGLLRLRPTGDGVVYQLVILQDYVLAVGTVLIVLALAAYHMRQAPRFALLWTSFPALAVLTYVLTLAGFSQDLPVFLFSAYTLVCGFACLVHGIQNEDISVANYGVLVVGALLSAHNMIASDPVVGPGLGLGVLTSALAATTLSLLYQRERA